MYDYTQGVVLYVEWKILSNDEGQNEEALSGFNYTFRIKGSLSIQKKIIL